MSSCAFRFLRARGCRVYDCVQKALIKWVISANDISIRNNEVLGVYLTARKVLPSPVEEGKSTLFSSSSTRGFWASPFVAVLTDFFLLFLGEFDGAWICVATGREYTSRFVVVAMTS